MTETSVSSSAAFARTTRAAVKAGGRYMTSLELKAAAKPLGLRRSMLYLRGRIGAVGEVGVVGTTATYGMFPQWLIAMTWDETASLSAHDAASAYSDGCSNWGRAHLAGMRDAARLAELAERIADGADSSALVLFAAWRAWPREDDAPARAAHAVDLLRELRGGLHFASLRAHGIDVPVALIADPEAGPGQMRKTGWTDEAVAAVQGRADAIPDLAERWGLAEEDTNDALALCCELLSDEERDELATHLHEFEEVSRPAAV